MPPQQFNATFPTPACSEVHLPCNCPYSFVGTTRIEAITPATLTKRRRAA